MGRELRITGGEDIVFPGRIYASCHRQMETEYSLESKLNMRSVALRNIRNVPNSGFRRLL